MKTSAAAVLPFYFMALLKTSSASSVKSLTADDFYDETSGKTVFIKFFAPWCGHCKAMAPDWEKLADDYASQSKDIVIGEVDCADEDNMDLCDEVGVDGFPTLMYGDPQALEDYDGERDYDALKEFAEAELKPSCSPNNLDLCDEETKALIAQLKTLSLEEIDEKINAVEDLLEEAEDWFNDEEDKLQDLYEKLDNDYREKTRKIKSDSNLKWLKSVQSALEAADDSEAEL